MIDAKPVLMKRTERDRYVVVKGFWQTISLGAESLVICRKTQITGGLSVQ